MRFLLVAAILSMSTPAWAVPRSPVSIQEQLGLSYQPPCSICHTGNGVPNAGDVTSPFAKSMLANGLIPNNRPAMNAALAALEAAHIDSDGDGFTDIAELRIGLDPSVGDVTPPAAAPAASGDADTASRRGCSTSPGASPSFSLGAWLVLGIALMGLRRRRRSKAWM